MISREYVSKLINFQLDNGPDIYVSIDGENAIKLKDCDNRDEARAYFVDRFGGKPVEIFVGFLREIPSDTNNFETPNREIVEYNRRMNTTLPVISSDENKSIIDREALIDLVTYYVNSELEYRNPQIFIDKYYANRNHKIEIYTKESFTANQKVGFIIATIVIVLALLVTGFTIYFVTGKSTGGNTLMFNH